VKGFVPRLALLFPPDQQGSIFPELVLDGGARRVPSVPPTLLLSDFRAWQGSAARPPWITPVDWEQLDQLTAATTLTAIEAATSNHQPDWNDWLDQVDSSQREEQALMDEWIVLAGGGRELFTSKSHYVYKQADRSGPYWGTAVKGQVLRWTGQVRTDDQKPLYEVDFYRMSKAMRGWFRGDIMAEYFFPTEQNDPAIAKNKDNVFDLSVPILRHPQDPEFAAAKEAGYTGAQYLDIRNALGRGLRHYCLCGEICVAALTSSDVIPLLSQWLNSGYWRVDQILNNSKMGTHVGDLRSILDMYNREREMYNSAPVPPKFVKDRLMRGEFAISGCGITSSGIVKADGHIRHWVIVEDVLPVGSSGWVRIYNPFQNQEEVYEYDMFMTSAGTGTGLWIMPE
jgi:hypothetical protein